jgi:methionine aminopeptidase
MVVNRDRSNKDVAALKQVLEQVRAGVSVLELCRTGDHAINTLVSVCIESVYT